jgi:hypothetical protein
MPDSIPSKAEAIVGDLLDEMLPEEVDWQDLVRAWPLPALALAALGGFLVGRRHGPAIVSAISSFASAEVAKNVSSLLGQEVEL